LKVIGTTGCVEEAIEKVNADEFDMIILDLYLPDKDPVKNVRALKAKYGEKLIIIYTIEKGFYWMRVMYNEDVAGYIHKDGPDAKIRESIKKAFNGERVFPEYFISELSKDVNRIKNNDYEISSEQQLILIFLIHGYSSKEIAKKTGSNMFSVNNKLRILRRKFGVKNNVELAVKIVELKII